MLKQLNIKIYNVKLHGYGVFDKNILCYKKNYPMLHFKRCYKKNYSMLQKKDVTKKIIYVTKKIKNVR